MASAPPTSGLSAGQNPVESRDWRLAQAGVVDTKTATSITAVEIVATPDERWFKRRVAWIAYDNKDSIAHTFILSIYDGTTDHDFWKELMPAGNTGFWRLPVTLDQNKTQSIRGRLAEAIVTTQPEFVAQYEDLY